MLLHGPPGTGKTLSVMYLLHAMPGRTTILLTGRGLGLIEQALAIGRDLAPATFVFEDIDLVAAERTIEFGSEERSTLTRRLLGQPSGGDGIAPAGGAFPGILHALNAAGLPIPPSPSTARDFP